MCLEPFRKQSFTFADVILCLLKNVAIFTGKHLYWDLFLIKVQA